MWDYKEIEREMKKLNIPKEYSHIRLDKLFANDYYIMLSIRKDSGKTTNTLLMGAVLFKLYGTTTEYIRTDTAMTKRATTETMYDVIKDCGYISKIFDGEYNDIILKPMIKKWYLVQRDENNEIVKQCDAPICAMHSIEDWLDIKSTYNNPKGDYLVFDEFCDSKRSTTTQMVELMNTISSITRERPTSRVILLSNNVNKYAFWWSEFTIEKEIPTLEFGGYIEKRTEYGTTLFCELLDLSKKKKEDQRNKNIRFFGFNTPKMNAFNGLASWQGSSHQHIDSDDLLIMDKLVTNRIYILHRNRYVQINLYFDDERGDYCFLHYSNPPQMDDNLILTLAPKSKNEIFGFGKFYPKKKVRDVLYRIVGMRTENKWYYSSNSVGDLIDDYFKEME